METKEKFLREVNQAFSEGNTEFLLNRISDDFCWTIVGEKTISGKTEFTEAMDHMKDLPPMKISIDNIMMDGNTATVEGIVVGKNRNGQRKYFAFCDIFKLKGNDDLKISAMTSYVIDVSKHKRYKESF